jgi:uncharacterized repeat protein (TIGR01451 family)
LRNPRITRLGLVVATLIGAFGTAIAAAAPAGAATLGPYSGAASGNLVGLTALTIPGTLQAAAVALAPTTAQVSSTANLAAATGKDSYARADNLDASLISGSVNLDNLVVEADQSAPPDNPTAATKTLASVPADPLADATLTTATASARWLGADTCVPLGTDIAHGTSTAATANLVTGTPLGSAVVSVVNSAGGPVTSDSSVKLVAVPDQDNEGLQSTQLDQITSIVLFKGTAEEVDINVAAPPMITATATGFPGGASVTYTEPILTVVEGGKTLGTLNAATSQTTLTIPDLATLSLGTLTKTLAANGTSASGSADLLNIQIGVATINVANLTVAGGSVAAAVPVGGLPCTNPLGEAHKDSSTTAVAPGQSFTYTITVPNRGVCPLVDVVATDTITAPAGTQVSSVPPPSSVSGGGLTLTYDIGTLAPNATVNIPITIVAPPGTPAGYVFSDAGTVSGMCNNEPPGTPPYTQPISFTGPTTFVPAEPDCHLDQSNKASDHLQVVPGETFNYYVHVLNDGTSECTNVVVTDPLGPGVTFVSATDGGTASGGTVTWTIPTMASGASETLTVEVEANPSDKTGTTLPDTATIRSTQEPNGIPVSTPGPTVTGLSVLAPPNPASPASPDAVVASPTLPFTGGQPLAPWGLGLLIAGAVAWAWRRRSGMTTPANRRN